MPEASHPGEELLDTLTHMVGDAVYTHGKHARIKGTFTRAWMDLMDGYVAGLIGMAPKHNSSDCFTFAGFIFNIVEKPGVTGVVYVEDKVTIKPHFSPYPKNPFADALDALDSMEAFLKSHKPAPLTQSNIEWLNKMTDQMKKDVQKDAGEFDVEGMN